MSIVVYTAHISTRDPDRLDVTRKTGGDFGTVFAPSWGILKPALDARRAARYAMTEAQRKAAEKRAEDAWDAYVPAYLAEMAASRRARPKVWQSLMTARPRRVLVCYCMDPKRCHRTLLASLLVEMGAENRGELS